MENRIDTQIVDLPRTARNHFKLHFFAALYYLVHHIHRLAEANGSNLEETFTQYPFLAHYFQEVLAAMPDEITWEGGLLWWQETITQWEETAVTPLTSLAKSSQLNVVARIALVFIGLVEEDSRLGTLIADLQRPLENRRPTLELVLQVMHSDVIPAEETEQYLHQLIQTGLIHIPNRNVPRAEWNLIVPDLLWPLLRGETTHAPPDWCHFHTSEQFPALNELIFSAPFLAQLAQLPRLITEGKAQVIVLRGTQGSDRLRVCGAIARSLGFNFMAVDAAKYEKQTNRTILGPLCAMMHALPIFIANLSPGETLTTPVVAGWHGPRLIMLNLAGGLRHPTSEKTITLTLPELKASERHQHWLEALNGHKVEGLSEISQRFRLPGDTIRQLAPIAIAQAVLNQQDAITFADVQIACRLLNREMLDTLATSVPIEGSWEDLIVGQGTRSKLHELTLRCQHREHLLEHLAPVFGTATNTGVRALFTGGSGTGKTLAARILAAELGMDLYRVDLAAVINKYIGETEKNLHRVLSRSEELDVILLLDEGDSLLSSRTDVKSANDRYANLETNYLLQRLEQYRGIVVITTNIGENIDSAFQRRMDVVVNFVPPKVEERLRIWQLHLLDNSAIHARFLETVAQRCSLTGGQIRNAAMHATLLSVAAKTAVTEEHLLAAIESEYRKAGATSPLTENGRSVHHNGNVTSFLESLSR